jgi:hypothetical protein
MRTIGEDGRHHIAVKGMSNAVIVQQPGEGSGRLQKSSGFSHDQATQQGEEDLGEMSGAEHDVGFRKQVGRGFGARERKPVAVYVLGYKATL